MGLCGLAWLLAEEGALGHLGLPVLQRSVPGGLRPPAGPLFFVPVLAHGSLLLRLIFVRNTRG